MLGSRKRPVIVIQSGFFTVAALILLLIPVKWVISWIIAATIHEAGHCVAVILCRANIRRIRIGAFGARIETCPLSVGKEMFCVAAGPICGLVPVLLSRYIPNIAVCAFFQTIFNLIPVKNHDGGRLVYCALQSIFSKSTADKLCWLIDKTVTALLIILLGLFIIKTAGIITAIAVCLITTGVAIAGKIPCKWGKVIVQ